MHNSKNRPVRVRIHLHRLYLAASSVVVDRSRMLTRRRPDSSRSRTDDTIRGFDNEIGKRCGKQTKNKAVFSNQVDVAEPRILPAIELINQNHILTPIHIRFNFDGIFQFFRIFF